MKKTRTPMLTLACVFALATAGMADTPVTPDKLPAAVKTFVKEQFPQAKILFAEKDSGLLEKTAYEIRLDDGTEVEIYKNGEWDKIENKAKGVPAGFVPKAIADYAKANYADATITKIDKEGKGFEVELSTGLELKFNKKGKLVGMDD